MQNNNNVVRLSADTVDLLESYREIKINSISKYVFDEHMKESEILRFKEMNYSSLINHAVFDSVFWEKKNL